MFEEAINAMSKLKKQAGVEQHSSDHETQHE
jgi:hypothetical protein